MAEVKRNPGLPDNENPIYNPSFVGRKDGNHNGPTPAPSPAAAAEEIPAAAALPAAPVEPTPATALAVDPAHLKPAE